MNEENRNERWEKQLTFCRELDKEKSISRVTHLIGRARPENDAEHAWHMALMAYLLQEYANEPIDIGRTILMILLHDVVEIDAGDTYAYDPDPTRKASQRERESAAADRLFSMLPEDQGRALRSLWEEFDAYETPEARFAHTMDNFQPMLLNDANQGQDWLDHGIVRSQVLERNAKTGSGSETIWAYMQTVIDKHVRQGSLRDDRKDEDQ